MTDIDCQGRRPTIELDVGHHTSDRSALGQPQMFGANQQRGGFTDRTAIAFSWQVTDTFNGYPGCRARTGQQVARADEVGNENVGWLPVQGHGRGDLLDAALVQDRDAVSHRHGFFLIVSHDGKGDAHLVLQALQFALHLRTHLLVERRQRFIE